MKQQKTKLKTWLEAHLPALLAILIVLQPLLDVLSFWQNEWNWGNGLTLLLRFGILAAVAAAGFLLSDRRRYYAVLALVLLSFGACHTAAILQADMVTVAEQGEATGIGALFLDLANYVRVAQLPIFTMAFITFLKKSGEKGFSAVKKSLIAVLLLIAAVEVISVITGTNPYTYPDKELGWLGWFSATNAQSAVLSMVVPVALMTVIQKKEWSMPLKTALCVIGFGLLFLFGTRLTFAALLLTGVGLSFTILVADRRQIRSAVMLLLCTAICAVGIGHSPMLRNRQQMAENIIIKQEILDALVADDEAQASRHVEGELLEQTRLVGAYHYYLGGLVEKYGLPRVAELYEYSTEATLVADNRVEKKNFCKMMMEDAPALAPWFGMELGDMTYRGVNYDLENDFHGIYMLYGGVGLGLLLLFFLYFAGLILWALLRDAKKYYTMEAGAFGIAFLTALMHAYATAGVLRRPNASVYLALVLAVIFYLVLVRQYQQETTIATK